MSILYFLFHRKGHVLVADAEGEPGVIVYFVEQSCRPQPVFSLVSKTYQS